VLATGGEEVVRNFRGIFLALPETEQRSYSVVSKLEVGTSTNLIWREIAEYQIERIQAGNAHCPLGTNETAARAD
jgi:hypothetical protein